MSKNLFIFFGLLIILGVGFWFRVSGILSNSFAFTYDVGRDLLEVVKIVKEGNFTLIGQTTGLPGLFYGPWWYYILSIPFILSDGNPQGINLFLALLGIVTVFLGYVFGKKLGGIFLGLILASIIAFSPYMVSLSSQIWNPNIAPFFIILLLLVLKRIFDKEFAKDKISFLTLGILLSLLIDTEIIFGIFFLTGIALSLMLIFGKKVWSWNILYTALGILLILSPRILFEFRHSFIMTKTIFNNLEMQTSANFLIPGIKIIFNRIEFFNNLFSETVAHGNKIISLFIFIFVLIANAIGFSRASKIEKMFIKTIIVVFLVFFLGLTFFSSYIFDHYVIGLPLLYIIMLGMGINFLGKYIIGKKYSLIFLFLLLYLNINPINFINNLGKPLWEGNAAVYRNQLAVMDYIYKDAKGENFKYIVYTPPIHDYTYKYLFSWYGKSKYGYTPEEKNSKLFYVILEPDYELPFRLRDWLKDREGDGIVQKEKVVKGKIVVQTRIN